MLKPISRATLLKGLAGLAIAGGSAELLFQILGKSSNIPCRILGPSVALGHALRDKRIGSVPPDVPVTETAVTIIGGGIAGLSAAWWLKKQGFNDFTVLELEPDVGGNSRSGRNQVSAYPWGAHYVPLANDESVYVRMLFEELGIVNGADSKGVPIYNDLYLCHEPQERLLKDGSFQEGLIPRRGLQNSEREEMSRFFAQMDKFRRMIGSDGKPAFAIPLDLSSQDKDILRLDQISMAEWLKGNDFHAKPLLWYVNYCCRDDYGSSINNVSAWAGVHYFAGRRGRAANAELNSVVTWPEGNGFIVNKLKERLQSHVETNALVVKVAKNEGAVTSYMNTKTNSHRVIKSKCVIFAAPRFLAPHLIDDYRKHEAQEPVYAPWLVANLTLKRIPSERGIQLAWDNVSYLSNSLGYVVATHQNITTREGATVITYYYPLSQNDPAIERGQMLKSSAQEWRKLVTEDLEKMHPGITEEILSIDIWPWGHGMIRPSVGFLWGETRDKMKESHGNVFFAHSDMSGMSNFEEAQYHGVEAATRVLSKLKQV